MRIGDLKAGNKWMLWMRLETSEVFVEWLSLDSLCTKSKTKKLKAKARQRKQNYI